jgi:molybdopterin-guanine dinucleotide biosynthesis protein
LRLISQYRGYEGPTLQEEHAEYIASGDGGQVRKVTQKGYSAAPFVHMDVTEWERKAAIEQWGGKLRGLTDGEDPITRLSSYDTEVAAREHGWTPAQKEKFEQVLRESPACGQDYIIVEALKIDPPAPNWVKNTSVHGQRKLEHVVERAVRDVQEQGYDVGAVVAFERQERRRESDAIIAALQNLSPAVEEELISA